MFSLFERKPDHVLFDLAEAGRRISELPQDDPYRALMGEKKHDARLTRLLARGEDCEQIRFEWLQG